MLDEITTSQCGRYGQAEFRFKVDPSRVLRVDIDWLRQTLEGWVANGERFRDGETIQLGWGLLKISSNSDGTNSLLEPDFGTLPIEWIDVVTDSLANLRKQKDVCESYFDADETAFPSLRQSAVVCTELRGSDRIVMERLTADPPDSGWFIGCGYDSHDHNSPDHLQRVSLYEAVRQNSKALMFLALPVGTLLEADDQDILLYRDGSLIEPRANSYMQKVRARRTK